MPDDEADTRGVEAISDEELDSIRPFVTKYPALSGNVPRLIARIDAEVLKRQEAERERDVAQREQAHLISTLDESHALIQSLRRALKRAQEDYGDLVRHHTEAEHIGTRLANLARAQIEGTEVVDDNVLMEAVQAWDDHQWPEIAAAALDREGEDG